VRSTAPVPHAATSSRAVPTAMTGTRCDATVEATTGVARKSAVEPASHAVATDAAPSHPLLTAATVGRDVFSPSFSRDGHEIYFHAGRNAAPLMRGEYDDGVVTHVAPVIDDGASNYHVVPSPDGSMIAFDSDRAGDRAVYVARSDGSKPMRVSGDGFAAVPSWSPDGRRLAFVKAEPGRPRVWNVWVADRRTGRLQRITADTTGQPWGASWFPDGRHLAYSREAQLILLDLATGKRTTFASPVAGHLVRTPAVSPDGSRVVFQVYRDGVWMLDLATRRVHRVMANASAEEFRWSPDGRSVVFHARNGRGWGVWIANTAAR
jgi:Tol biopolymer transport system component